MFQTYKFIKIIFNTIIYLKNIGTKHKNYLILINFNILSLNKIKVKLIKILGFYHVSAFSPLMNSLYTCWIIGLEKPWFLNKLIIF